MKIAVIGAGISGNTAAYHLNKSHDITVYEANDYAGGHTNTHEIVYEGSSYSIDTGFIVYNEWTYPHFIDILDELNVETQKSDMSFAVKSNKTGLEYNGSTLNQLFAQRSNFLRPSFYRMIFDILRFNREAIELLDDDDESITLGKYLESRNYSRQFCDNYIIPMGAAIWSSDVRGMLDFPAAVFVRFFKNHGLLSVNDRPEWRTITGGSNKYVEKLTESFRNKIRLNSPVRAVRRYEDRVEVEDFNGKTENYDYIFFAAHSDQVLKILKDSSSLEKEVLGSIPYQKNTAVLHTDCSLMPERKSVWASWNYHILEDKFQNVAVTYWMNRLQNIKAPVDFMVTLNYTDAIDDKKILKVIEYMHPLFTTKALRAQKLHSVINGKNRTFFCGAYWRYGFHEDGVLSALESLKQFNTLVYQNEKLYI